MPSNIVDAPLFLCHSTFRSSVRCVAQNKIFSKTLLTVEFAWENTFVQNANFSMMMFQRSIIIVTNVEFAELEGGRSSSTVINAVQAKLVLILMLIGASLMFCTLFYVGDSEIPASGCCYSRLLKDSHRCVEGAMHHNCPVCFEYLFDSTKEVTALTCGHTIHLGCLNEMMQHLQFTCPACSKSVFDMSKSVGDA